MNSDFNNQSKELSSEGIKMAHKIAEAFRSRGQDNGITGTQIIQKMTEKGYDINGVKLKKIINYIQINNMLNWLIQDGTGEYVYTSDVEKIKKYSKFLEARQRAIRETRLSFNTDV